jgi:hypothetical protein
MPPSDPDQVARTGLANGRVYRTMGIACVCLVALPCAAVGDPAFACPKLRGPFIVTPKRMVVFKLGGFQAGAPVFVTVGPLQIGEALTRSQVLRKTFRIDANGLMKLRFRWPAHGTVSGDGYSYGIPWIDGERAYVNADVGSLVARSACAYKHVTIRFAQ